MVYEAIPKPALVTTEASDKPRTPTGHELLFVREIATPLSCPRSGGSMTQRFWHPNEPT